MPPEGRWDGAHRTCFMLFLKTQEHELEEEGTILTLHAGPLTDGVVKPTVLQGVYRRHGRLVPVACMTMAGEQAAELRVDAGTSLGAFGARLLGELRWEEAPQLMLADGRALSAVEGQRALQRVLGCGGAALHQMTRDGRKVPSTGIVLPAEEAQ